MRMRTKARKAVFRNVNKFDDFRGNNHEALTRFFSHMGTRIAVNEMMDFLVKEKALTREEAYILASDAVDLRITQLVDGKMGVHALLPKGIFLR